jgi:pimeloyl-ACP methyl ester carboxylesterase
MNKRSVIFVPGKNPKPPAEQHRELLWRTLLEGVRRAVPNCFDDLAAHEKDFRLIAWNNLYYQQSKDISRDLPWIDALINTHTASVEDIHQANSWKIKLDKLFIKIADIFPFIIPLLSKPIRRSAYETDRYFENKNNVACRIRGLLKEELRSRLSNNEKVLLIGHSMGSIIAYDTLWELSQEEKLSGKIDMFLTIGSPLALNFIQSRLMGHDRNGKQKYPANIRHWVNISSVGDVVAVERDFSKSFKKMRSLNMIESIDDHCDGIYNYFHNEEGLNVHRSYGYLVNPAVGKVIADWWKQAE